MNNMNQNICIPQNYFLLLLVFLICLTIFTMYKNKQLIDNNIIKLNNTKILSQSDETKIGLKKIPNNKIFFDELPIKQFLVNRDKSILYDSFSISEKKTNINKLLTDKNIIYDPFNVSKNQIENNHLINIPTRGYPDSYKLLGILTRESDEKILQLFGRAKYLGSSQYEYYVTTEQNGFINKIPIETKSQKELYDNDSISIREFDKTKGDFKVSLYNSTLRYIPII